MPRVARLKSEFSTYHIILRGNERKDIFLDTGDKEHFLRTLSAMKGKYNFHIYAYCLMDNHLHLILYDNGNDISMIMKSINLSYAVYFNKRYKRVGHLFQDRFRSEIVDTDKYLLELSKYIHNNPVKAGIVKDPRDYPWSSFPEYMGMDTSSKHDILSVSKILDMLSDNQILARKEYFKYTLNSDEDLDTDEIMSFVFSDYENRDYYDSFNDGRKKLDEIANEKGKSVEELILNMGERDFAIRELRKHTALTLKDIGRLTGGLSESRVSRILKR